MFKYTYDARPSNSREVERETDIIRTLVKRMKRHGVEVSQNEITRTVTNIEIPTSINSRGEASADLLSDIAEMKGELNSGVIYIKRPVLRSYGSLGIIFLSAASWVIWGWISWREILELL